MIIRRETLQAALAATTNDDTRYHLNAIHVRVDGSVEGTNGHVAIVAKEYTPLPDEDFPVIQGLDPFHGSPAEPVLLPADVVKAMIAAMPKGKRALPILGAVQLAANGTGSTIAATDLQAPRTAKIEPGQVGAFPTLERVMPAADKADTVDLYLAADVLETLCKAARAIRGKSAKAPVLRFAVPFGRVDRQKIGRDDKQDPDVRELAEVSSAVRVTVHGPEVELVMAVMPCRG